MIKWVPPQGEGKTCLYQGNGRQLSVSFPKATSTLGLGNLLPPPLTSAVSFQCTSEATTLSSDSLITDTELSAAFPEADWGAAGLPVAAWGNQPAVLAGASV